MIGTRDEAHTFIAHTLEYGSGNADAWLLAAGFADDHCWHHPRGVLTVSWVGYDQSDASLYRVTVHS